MHDPRNVGFGDPLAGKIVGVLVDDVLKSGFLTAARVYATLFKPNESSVGVLTDLDDAVRVEFQSIAPSFRNEVSAVPGVPGRAVVPSDVVRTAVIATVRGAVGSIPTGCVRPAARVVGVGRPVAGAVPTDCVRALRGAAARGVAG
jgi:hypothetical protein